MAGEPGVGFEPTTCCFTRAAALPTELTRRRRVKVTVRDRRAIVVHATAAAARRSTTRCCRASGSRATTSQRSRASRDRPRPFGAEHEHEGRSATARSSTRRRRRRRRARRDHTPARAARVERGRACPTTDAIGRYSIAPAAAFATAGVSPAARCAGARRRSRPRVSALRSTAPRFCGSVTPSSATRNAAGSASSVVEVAPARPDRRARRRPAATRCAPARRADLGRRDAPRRPATRRSSASSSISA